MKNILFVLLLGIMVTVTAYMPSDTENFIPSLSCIVFDGSVSEDEVPHCSRGRIA